MASQPTFAPYMPLRHAAPKPNIRIAYIAGDASIAIQRGMAAEPAAKRESTLEELAIAGLAGELIAAGRELLSPSMYAAFLRWGEVSSHFSTDHQGDEEGTRRCTLTSNALSAVTAITPGNKHDMALKMYLASMEAADCAAFSALSMADAAMANIAPDLIESLARDLPAQSPVIACLEELGKLAWTASGNPAFSLSLPIGTIITSAFRAARGELDLAIPAPSPLPAVLDGYSPYMRGPLVAWQKAYAVYEAAAAELHAYQRDVYSPTAARYTELRGDPRSPLTAEIEAWLSTVPIDEVQDHFDDLVMAKHDASERLWAMPAPSTVELATKLKIFHEAEGWDLTCAGDVIERITADARRFGRYGAFLQPDLNLLAAFRRRAAEAAYWLSDDHPPATDEIEERSNAIVVEAEAVLFGTAATTVEGVIAKLRTLYPHISQDAFAEHAVTNPRHPDFRAGLKVADGNDQVLWACIEDLARIGGNDLTEQGA
ncbi:hypothetical protein [Sphingomonas sp. CV7422]|uniref:hypothetical protein n=1 Tax=Sphingomonas sp. CV7422 TaxID=3018036 RepID=UPI0022FE7E1A|nr:hypothetical protein [Sphingomonas sp. CV7422]